MVNIKLGILEMVEKAREQIEEVEVEDAIAESKDSDCLIIDVRDVRERKRDGYIPESFHCPRGMIEFWLEGPNRIHERLNYKKESNKWVREILYP